ncbi:Flp family type IVb pilin [Novosphingobium sp. B1]|uniref:Flp family type IVb pilin n=1 Tax=Novosphingobium sp. B1 TaxID=1938756 RepID=UPI0009D90DCB|nr:Flp family type IVb pilin [Novosphingobium sp. B1]SMC31278.1 pilus assembly protein Flp/PilA [Novosphingobium sp. B1]
MKLFRNLLADNEGATAIEYGLIAALVAVAAIGAMSQLGTSLTETFGQVSTEMQDAKTAGPITTTP